MLLGGQKVNIGEFLFSYFSSLQIFCCVLGSIFSYEKLDFILKKISLPCLLQIFLFFIFVRLGKLQITFGGLCQRVRHFATKSQCWRVLPTIYYSKSMLFFFARVWHDFSCTVSKKITCAGRYFCELSLRALSG